jgi:hypothetical protein
LTGSGNLTIAGPSKFVLAGAIYQDASGKPSSPPTALSLGYATTTNVFDIGTDGTYSLYENNGAALFSDADGSSTGTCSSSTSTFCMAGGVFTTGGTCLALSAAGEHDING